MVTKMATRSGRSIKPEPIGSPTESTGSGTMPPPSQSPSPKKRKLQPHEEYQESVKRGYRETPSLATGSVAGTHSVAPSGARSFVRSHAPSAETWNRRVDDDPEPMFMEMRRRPDLPEDGRHASPSSQNADTTFAQQSFAHPTFTDIGLKQKACNDTLGDLQTLGVSHVAALPELVLVGDQSSGKSSLMSGLARVNLPRSAGVCTRCPLHIRLISSNTDRWSCTVSLQRDYNYRPFPDRKPRTSDVTRANPFPPWVKMSHRDTKPFKTIYNPSEIEEVLRWAQIAILNHDRNYELFIPGEGSVTKGVPLDVAARETDAQFSPNIVALEIKGPGLPDLSFYDLPGVFMSPEKEEDEYVVKVVRNLTLEYIGREKAIIMWALPMNVDSENSISLDIIRKSGAPDRTIGVMTKADQLPPQNIFNWLAMFRGEKQVVGHGFFATSRPPNEDLEEAEKWEQLFFQREVNSLTSWPNEFSEFENRCGVKVLLDYLSSQLGEAFARSLPSIKDMVYTRLKVIERDLDALPELPKNVEHEVKKSLMQFLQQMKNALRDTEFLSEWNTLNSQFQACIFNIKPKCTLKDTETQTIDISSADSDATTPKRPRPSDSTMRNINLAQTPSRRQHQNAATTPVKQEDAPMGGISRSSSVVGGPPRTDLRSSPFARFAVLGRGAMDIKEIRSEILRKKRPGMPRDLVPDEVRETLCMTAVKKWVHPLETYMEKTAELLEKTANAALEESLGGLRRRLIFSECQKQLKQFIARAVALQKGRLDDMYNSEIYQLYMMNDDVFHRYKAQEMEQLKRVRGILRLKAIALIPWDTPVKRLEDMSEDEKTKERKMLDSNIPKLQKDPYDTEIEVAGFVRGYYMMAAARFVEGVAMNVNSNLLRTFRESELESHLDDHFKIFGNADQDLYLRWMDEDNNTAKRRIQLKAEMEKLVKAMHSINDLESSFGRANLNHQNVTIIDDSEMEDAA